MSKQQVGLKKLRGMIVNNIDFFSIILRDDYNGKSYYYKVPSLETIQSAFKYAIQGSEEVCPLSPYPDSNLNSIGMMPIAFYESRAFNRLRRALKAYEVK